MKLDPTSALFALACLAALPCFAEDKLRAQAPGAAQGEARILRAYDVKDLIRPPSLRKAPNTNARSASAPNDASPGAGASDAASNARKLGTTKVEVRGDKNPLLEHFGLDGTKLASKGKGAREKRKQDTSQVDGLVRLIRAFCTPELASDDLVDAVGARGLVVRAPLAAHEWVARFLAGLRRNKKTLLYLEFQLLSMSKAQYDARITPVFRAAVRAQPAEEEHVILRPGARTTKFLESLLSAPQIDSLLLPRVVLNNDTGVTIQSLNQVAYIKDFKVEASKDGKALVADPVVGVVHDGERFYGNAAILPNGRLGLDFELSISKLKRPIAEFKTQLPIEGSSPVTIQLPEVTVSRLVTSFECRPNDIAIFGLPALGEKRSVLVAQMRTIEAGKGK